MRSEIRPKYFWWNWKYKFTHFFNSSCIFQNFISTEHCRVPTSFVWDHSKLWNPYDIILFKKIKLHTLTRFLRQYLLIWYRTETNDWVQIHDWVRSHLRYLFSRSRHQFVRSQSKKWLLPKNFPGNWQVWCVLSFCLG